ncbi:hypothetical protein EBR21_14595, partial [bacterium]|nr:hypothetical protein [bacterium]
NWNGQLGDGTFIQKSAPTTVSPTVVVKSDPNAVPMTFDEASTYCKRCHEFAKSPSLWKNNAAASKSRLVEGTMPPQNRYYDMFSRYPYSANLTTADRQRLIDYISGL